MGGNPTPLSGSKDGQLGPARLHYKETLGLLLSVLWVIVARPHLSFIRLPLFICMWSKALRVERILHVNWDL